MWSYIDTESRHFTPAGSNIFADLGFGEEESAALKAESDRIITEKLAMPRHGAEIDFNPDSLRSANKTINDLARAYNELLSEYNQAIYIMRSYCPVEIISTFNQYERVEIE